MLARAKVCYSVTALVYVEHWFESEGELLSGFGKVGCVLAWKERLLALGCQAWLQLVWFCFGFGFLVALASPLS